MGKLPNITQPKRIKRVTIYVDEKEFNIFKSRLALKGKTISGWFRDNVRHIAKSV